MDVFRLTGEVTHLWCRQLHFRRELIGCDPGTELVVPAVGFGVLGVRRAEEFAGRVVFGERDVSWSAQIA